MTMDRKKNEWKSWEYDMPPIGIEKIEIQRIGEMKKSVVDRNSLPSEFNVAGLLWRAV